MLLPTQAKDLSASRTPPTTSQRLRLVHGRACAAVAPLDVQSSQALTPMTAFFGPRGRIASQVLEVKQSLTGVPPPATPSLSLAVSAPELQARTRLGRLPALDWGPYEAR